LAKGPGPDSAIVPSLVFYECNQMLAPLSQATKLISID